MEPKPKFRPDLKRHSYEEKSGELSVILEDPASGKYFRLSRYEFDLLNTFDGTITISDAVEQLRLRGRYFDPDYATKLVDQFARSGLLLGTAYGTSRVQAAYKSRLREELKKRSIFKIFYFYLPLFNPDHFLERTLPVYRLVVNRFTATLMIPAALGAIFLMINSRAKLEDQFYFFFNLSNILWLWFAIAGVKLVHEFAHGYTAKSFGLRVPEMGIALLIFLPRPYCDTTAAWRLADGDQRTAVALAGIFSEMVLAVFGCYVWYFTKPGIVNSISFYLVVVSSVSSLMFNGNPLLKFDGYFVLIDRLRIPNLQIKALQQIRYLFWNRVLGVSAITAPPAQKGERKIFVLYGVCAFLYRVFLVFAITSAVYYRFDKTIGLIMGSAAFALFIIRPIIQGGINFVKRRSEMSYHPAGLAAFVLSAAGCLILAILPWSDHTVYPCYLESSQVMEIAVPADAPVSEVFVRQGNMVEADSPILRLDLLSLDYALRDKVKEREYIQSEIAIIQNGQEDFEKLELKYIDLAQADDAVNKAAADLEKVVWKAPFKGAVVKFSENVQAGARPGKGAVVGELADLRKCSVAGLIPETDIARVNPGAEVEVWFPFNEGRSFTLRVSEIIPFKAEDLESSPLSSRFGGEIAVESREEGAKDSPLEPQYLCKMDFDNKDHLPLGMTGRLIIPHPPRSLMTRVISGAYHTFHREVVF